MRKRHRIILILFVVALVAGLVVAFSFSGRDEAPESSAWERMCSAGDDLMVKLGLFPRTRGCVLTTKSTCICNLKQIDGAKAIWALENKKSDTDAPTTTDLFRPTGYVCPEGGIYVLGSVQQKPRCSIPGHTL